MTDYAVRNGSMSLPLLWTSDALGNYSYELPDYRGYAIKSIQASHGLNGLGVTDVPTNLYDITLKDERGEDQGKSEFLNLDTSVTQTQHSLPPISVTGRLTLTIANAGAAKQGLFLIMLQREDS